MKKLQLKHMKKIGLISLLVYSLASCSSLEIKKSKFNIDGIDPRTIHYVTQNLDSIISSQEEDLGIHHFGSPKIIFRSCVERADRASYNPHTDVMEIFVPRAYVHFIPKRTEHLIRHELGHFYTDKLSENIGNGDWPRKEKKEIDWIRNRLVAEGVAEYFARKSNGEKDAFEDFQWPKTPEEFKNGGYSICYDGGFHLVKPVIDRYGKKGIEYLICNPPSAKDLKNLPEYQSRVLKYLSNQFQDKK